MARKSINKSENNTGKIENNSAVPAASVQDNAIKKRGRPKGSGKKGTRPDNTVQTMTGENSRFLLHDLKLFRLPKIDMNNPSAVQKRIEQYFSICAEDDIKPSIESLALSFNVSRFTLFDWMTDRNKSIKNPESILTLKTAYNAINSYYAHMMANGKINPVAGIFLMKNNMGYRDTTDYVISSGNNPDPSLQDISEKAGLLSD